MRGAPHKSRRRGSTPCSVPCAVGTHSIWPDGTAESRPRQTRFAPLRRGGVVTCAIEVTFCFVEPHGGLRPPGCAQNADEGLRAPFAPPEPRFWRWPRTNPRRPAARAPAFRRRWRASAVDPPPSREPLEGASEEFNTPRRRRCRSRKASFRVPAWPAVVYAWHTRRRHHLLHRLLHHQIVFATNSCLDSALPEDTP